MNKINRRTFIGTAALGTTVLGQVASGAAEGGTEGKKLKLGLIGCGWYGMVDVKAAFKAGGVEVIALCDVDSEHLSKSADEVAKLQGHRPQTFKLYQELLNTAGLEAVIIGTPPQWHALPFIAALEKGLDVYCEKPLAYDIREARAMVDAARKSGRIIQIGFQRRQSKAFQQVRQYLQDGSAGRIINVDVQIHYTAGVKDATPQEPPPSLDWDLWCGPAPKLPYSPQIGHMNWRLEKTTGQGHLVDWGIHLIDATRFMLGEKAPRTVQASGGIYYLKDKITTPDVLTVHFEFERCPVTWRHRIWGAEEYAPEVSNGIFFYGEKETVFVTDDKWIAIPRGKNKERKITEAKNDTGALHMAEFLTAVRERKQPGCPPEEAYLSTTAVKLAMISYDVGAKITWDAAAEQIVGNEAAARLLKRDYRAPWQHPYRGA
ncbi:MAG: Gfo/Idh/MocA family oxidoreductase [Verrucomicrobia bacterium]|nr:Gfo/Idh/MocA family oxidoreductase [Verrucomicrobiota bacterium]